MSPRRRTSRATRVRRGVQIVLLLFFVGLIIAARPSSGGDPSPLLKLWFWIDPLILITTFVAAHAVPLAALLAVGTILLTAVLGRVFCGWICPLGTLHDLSGRLFDLAHRDPKRRDHWSPWQRSKYYLLIALLVMAVFGFHWMCALDPLVLLYRSTTVALLPGTQWAVEEGSTAIYQADPHLGRLHLTTVTEPVYVFLRDHVFVCRNQAYLGSGLILLVLAGLLLSNAYRRRFWCRYLCPLGALLGFCSWRPLLQRTVEPQTCNQCDLCAMACHGAAAAAPGDGWKPSECLGCLNCSDSCVRGAVRFQWNWPWRKASGSEPVDLSRRASLGAAVGGLAALCLIRSGPQSRRLTVLRDPKLLRLVTYHPELIRPPGARAEREFLQRCTACGLCMKACPTGALQPAGCEAGLEGLWTPKLVPQIGYCEYACHLCGQVCPTEAIQPLALEAKQQVHIGLASFDTTRCIPYASGHDCMVCEEHCPIPTKAIYAVEVEIRDRDGATKKIRQPHVDPLLCTGCGQCENVCPFKDRPAIRVTSANETRNPANQPILPDDGGY